MSSMNVVRTFDRSPAPRAVRDEPVREAARDIEEAPEREGKPRANKAEFSALLALLAGQGDRVRADLVKQLPAESASLVDRLLEGAGEGTEEGDSETTALFPGTNGLQQAVNARGLLGDTTEATADEALRYGLLKLMPQDEQSSDVVDLAAYAKARDERTNGQQGLAGLANAVARAESHGNERALDALARVAARRGASLEQLLAVGDAKGADARAALDAILSQAGTPEGMKLADAKNAARKLMADTSAKALGESDDARVNGIDMASSNAAAVALANAAHASALAAANAASAADPTTPVRTTEALSPELRAGVERVIERMKQEYGHDVTIVESARSQERQDWLFEQGRSRGGPIVTWTRDSAHTRGEAVDVVVDGSWDNAEGFARLQRIAREEGLRTLGMKDPGHLELAKQGGASNAASLNARANDARQAAEPAAAAGMAQVASVAGVAGVARVADGARGMRMGQDTGVDTMSAGAAVYTSQQGAGKASGESQGNAFGRGERDENGKPLNDGKKLGHDKRDAAGAPAFGTMQGNGQSGIPQVTGTERAAQAASATGSEQAQRVSDIQQMRADAPASPLNRMVLNVEGANGVQEQITVDLRGNTVSTQITTDAATADRLRLRTADLQEALGRHGLESDTVRISGTKPADGTDSARAVASERDAMRVGTAQQSAAQDGAGNNGQRERAPSREWNQDESRREQSARAREQREQQERQQEQARRPFFPFGNE